MVVEKVTRRTNKRAISLKQLNAEQKLLLTAHKVIHALSIGSKMYDLE